MWMWSHQTALKTLLFPPAASSTLRRKDGRRKLLEVADSLLNEKYGDDVFVVATSGRYEFRNKGIDLFIDALGELNKSSDPDQTYTRIYSYPGKSLWTPQRPD